MIDAPKQPPQQWKPSTPPITAEEFEYVTSRGTVIVHFWAPWNQHDKTLDATLQPLIPAFQKKLRFYSLNTDDTTLSPIVESQNIGALPALICYSNSRSRARFYGIQTPEALKEFLDQMTIPMPRCSQEVELSPC